MNKVDTMNWAARSLLGVLLLVLLAAPTDLLAQQLQRANGDATPERSTAVQLDPGALTQWTEFSKSAAVTITQSASQAIVTFNSVSCNAGGLHTDNSYIRRFDLDDDHGLDGLIVSSVEFGIETATGAGGTQPVDVNLYTLAEGAALTFANLTMVGTSSASVANQALTILSVPVSGTVPAGADLVVEVFTPSGQGAGNSFFIGSNPSGETAPSYLAAADCGIPEPMTTGAIGFPTMHVVMNVVGDLLNVDADLSVEKGLDINENRTGSYHIAVTNNGPSDAGSVRVTDRLPGGITITGWSDTQGTFDPFSGVWDVGSLADGATAELWINVTFNAQGRYTNEVEITGSDKNDPDTSNNSDAVSSVLTGDRVVPDFVPGGGAGDIAFRGDRFTADLAVSKSVDVETATTDEDVTFTVVVENLGPQSTAKVEVTDALDDCLDFVSATADKGSYDAATGVWSVGSLKVGQQATLKLVGKVTADCGGTITNTAEVTSSSLPDPSDFFNLFDEPPATANNSASASFEANPTGRELDGTTFALGANYPNPFNPATVVPFSLAEAATVSIKVYDLLGRSVATLVDGPMAAGVHEVRFEASQLPTGMYLVRMEAAGISKTMRVTLMK